MNEHETLATMNHVEGFASSSMEPDIFWMTWFLKPVYECCKNLYIRNANEPLMYDNSNRCKSACVPKEERNERNGY